jgi:hypothetical protein
MTLSRMQLGGRGKTGGNPNKQGQKGEGQNNTRVPTGRKITSREEHLDRGQHAAQTAGHGTWKVGV